MMADMRTLVLGMGNPILRDDAVGIRLARDVRAQFEKASAGIAEAGPDSVPTADFIEDCSVGGLNLLDLVIGYDRLVVFDSIRTPGETPGTWRAMTGATFRETMNLGCVHDANFTTALELGRHMGAHLPRPEDVHIFAVEISDNTSFSEDMTPELEAAYAAFAPEIMREALALLRSV
jgi:hydrogenase maturation protease